jgi:hypothetical protein
VATIVAALIAKQSGAINISLSPTAAPTVTVTAAAPTITVTARADSTATASPSGGIANINCPANNSCKAYDLKLGYTSTESPGIFLMSGTIEFNAGGSDIYLEESTNGLPEIQTDNAQAMSTGVTAQDASLQQCISATTHDPDAQPITNFYKGMLFCVEVPGDGTPGDGTKGIALMEQTKPLDNSNTLYLHEIYWPNQ